MKEGDRRNKENEGRGYGREDGDVFVVEGRPLVFERVRLPDKALNIAKVRKRWGKADQRIHCIVSKKTSRNTKMILIGLFTTTGMLEGLTLGLTNTKGM